jgi:hypothetical protein
LSPSQEQPQQQGMDALPLLPLPQLSKYMAPPPQACAPFQCRVNQCRVNQCRVNQCRVNQCRVNQQSAHLSVPACLSGGWLYDNDSGQQHQHQQKLLLPMIRTSTSLQQSQHEQLSSLPPTLSSSVSMPQHALPTLRTSTSFQQQQQQQQQEQQPQHALPTLRTSTSFQQQQQQQHQQQQEHLTLPPIRTFSSCMAELPFQESLSVHDGFAARESKGSTSSDLYLTSLLPDMQTLQDPSEVACKELIGKGSYGSVYLGESDDCLNESLK